MKKNKLNIDYFFEFRLYGLITPLKDYKLAWHINHSLDIHLVKKEDILLDFYDKEDLTLSNFFFETQNSSLRLIRNRSQLEKGTTPRYLIPELHNFDYFLLLTGFEDTFDEEQFKNTIKNLKDVQFIQYFDPNNLKSKENLMF